MLYIVHRNQFLKNSLLLFESNMFIRTFVERSTAEMDTSKDKHKDDVKICKELMYETTAHGCRNILSTNRSNFLRFIWFCCVIGMGIGLFVTLHFMLEDYHAYPFNTVVKIGPKPKLKFPMVTVCDLSYLRVDRFPQPEAARNVFLSRSTFEEKIEINKSSNSFIQVENTPLDEAHNISNVTVDDIFKICKWKEQTVSCNEMWIPAFTDLGKCFVLNDSFDYFADSAGSNGALTFIAHIDQDGYILGDRYLAGLKLKLHDPHEDSRISDSGIFLSPGLASLIAVKKRSYTFLPDPFKAYGDEYCVANSKLTGRKKSNSTSTPSYHRGACIRSCVVNSVIKDCNCRSVTDVEYSSYKMCTIGQWLDCYQPAVRLAYTRNINEYNCTCPRICEFNTYETKLSFGMFPSVPALELFQNLNIIQKKFDGRNEYFDVTIFYEDLLLEEVSHVPVYSYISIMGIVGGQMGLFLGASFITVAEFLEIFLLFVWSKIKKVCCSFTIRRNTKTKDLTVKPAVKENVTSK